MNNHEIESATKKLRGLLILLRNTCDQAIADLDSCQWSSLLRFRPDNTVFDIQRLIIEIIVRTEQD
ncbi:MAG: hypothetical protein ACO3YZ_03535 [Candidatus Nanopelagicaceae bacterium]